MDTLLTWMPSSSIPIKTCMAYNAHQTVPRLMATTCLRLEAATANMRKLKMTANGYCSTAQKLPMQKITSTG